MQIASFEELLYVVPFSIYGLRDFLSTLLFLYFV